jgi:hypothetical protein
MSLSLYFMDSETLGLPRLSEAALSSLRERRIGEPIMAAPSLKNPWLRDPSGFRGEFILLDISSSPFIDLRLIIDLF